jgi:hypothetical protein
MKLRKASALCDWALDSTGVAVAVAGDFVTGRKPGSNPWVPCSQQPPSLVLSRQDKTSSNSSVLPILRFGRYVDYVAMP